MDLAVNKGRLNLPCAPPFYEKNSKVFLALTFYANFVLNLPKEMHYLLYWRDM